MAMHEIKSGRMVTPGDFFIETADGKNRLTFATKLEADRAQAFMGAAVQIGIERGEDRVATALDAAIEGLEDHIANCTELLGLFRRARKPTP